jgi:membrane-bound lytic murein transglycosylase D
MGTVRMLVTATLSVVAVGCGAGTPSAPPPIAVPIIEAHPPVVGGDHGLPWLGAAPPVDEARDEILASPMLRDPEVRREVERWVRFWETAGARWFPEYLERMSWFSPLVDSVLASHELPRSLRYLPIVESGYSPRAVSRASAVGLWQFMAPTARGFGMAVGPLLDERRDPFVSTAAAAEFLVDLRRQFGSWFLALAAYNAGPYRIEQILRRHAHPLAPRSDSLYWAMRSRMPRETRDFVPKLLGAVVVAANPRAHGFGPPLPTVGFPFDEVTVPDATTLDVVAEAAEAPQEEIERLNPEIVRGITPPGRRTELRVPTGSGSRFAENYARIPPGERVTFVEHRVVRGETFSHIAVRYGVRLADLRAANPRVQPRTLQIGQRITVPVAPRSR